MAQRWLQRFVGHIRKKPSSLPRRGFRPRAELLEDRLAPATFMVTTTADSGAGSLRQAMLDANALVGMDRIEFNIDGGGAHTISPASTLPGISSPVILDATTQPGWAGVPLITLDGAGGGGNAITLDNNSTGSTIKGLVIIRFNGSGIWVNNGTNQVIQNCYIGTNAAGVPGLGNGGHGIAAIFGGVNLLIGGSNPNEGNVISGNGIYGFSLSNGNNRLEGNIIGLNPAGTAALPNSTGGGALGGNNNTIGGPLPGARNVISGNNGPGFYSYDNGNLIQGNYIGTNAAGTSAIGNGSDGIHFAGGSTARVLGNVISGNGTGIAMYTSGNIIQGNFIGTNAAGNARVPNGDGIYVGRHGVFDNLIGGTTAAQRNIISGNNSWAITLTRGPERTRVEGNYIGLNAAGDLPLVNGGGIEIQGLNNTIGGTAPGAGNVISGNNASGISIQLGGTVGNQILGNRIGTNAAGTAGIPNANNGISVDSGSNTIGGTAPGAGNLIAFNTQSGIWINSGTGIPIRGNSIHSNNFLGIDLNPGGATPNDPGDTDTGANNRQNYPVLNPANSFNGMTAIVGSLNSIPNQTYQLEFFTNAVADPSGFGEGQTFLGSTSVTTDASGNVSFSISFPVAAPVGHFLTATATDAFGNTSEFSGRVNIFGPPAPPTISDIPDQAGFEDAIASVPFTVGDQETPPEQLTVTAVSSNQALVPNANIVVTGVGANRVLTITPALNATGPVTITVTVSDGGLSSMDTFVLNLQPVNDRPVIAVNTGLAVAPGATLVLSSSQLLVTDIDNVPAQIVLTVTTLPAHGVLQLNGSPLTVGGTFTQQNINDGQVRYIHNGSMTTTDGFAFSVSDGGSFTIALASQGMGGAAASSISTQPSISADGRYVTFRSQANNLVPGDTNNFQDIFIHDRLTGQTSRVSVGPNGVQGNGDSSVTFYRGNGVSGDGRYVAFYSSASNLVVGDTNNFSDAFVHDRQLNQTTRVSVSSTGVQSNNGVSVYGVAISADGQRVAFASSASNLVPNPGFVENVYYRDRPTSETALVSSAVPGPANGASHDVAISASGRYVVFWSQASNLVPNDTNNRADIFVRDLVTGEIARVSVDSAGNQANGDSNRPTISADGRYVVFESSATNLIASDTNNAPDIFLHDRTTGETVRINAPGGAQPTSASRTPVISADGRFIAFSSNAVNFVPGDTTLEDIFLYDRITGQFRKMSVTAGGVTGNNGSREPWISADGQTVAFESAASNLVPGAGINTHIYVADTGSVAGFVNITITPSLRVTSFTPTSSGFTALFNRAINLTELNLFSTETDFRGPPDVTIIGTNTGPATGSLVLNATGTGFTFIRTGGVLPADTYNVTFRSATNGIKALVGGDLLDGNADGTPGDNYTTAFTIGPISAVRVSIPDFARGPGQAVHVPATGMGLPLRLGYSAGITSVQLTLNYNPALLNITGVTVASGLPAEASVTLDTSTPGTALINFTSPMLSSDISEFVKLTATVPEAAGSQYTQKHILNLTNISINGGTIPSLDDDGLHLVAYLGDTTANARYSATDSQRILRVGVGLDLGFSAYPLTDPVIVADITGNGAVNSTDATRVLQESVGIDRPEIPGLPPNPPTIAVTGPDPLLSLPKRLRGRPGSTVVVPVNLDLSQGLDSANLAFSYDPSQLEVVEVGRGSLTGDFDIFAVNLDGEAGTIRVGLARSAGAIDNRGSGSVVKIVFRIKPKAGPGAAIVNLRQSVNTTPTQLNEGGLVLNPEPSDQAGDVLDGLIAIRPTRRQLLEARDAVFASLLTKRRSV